jgi:MSHA biogenesis protein MshJ
MNQLSDLTAHLARLQKSVNELSVRERALVFTTTVLILAMIWYLFLMQPLTRQAENQRKEIGTLQARIEASNQSFEDQLLQVAGTGSEYEQSYARMQRRIDEINALLGDYAAELIDPAEMARVLEGILKEQSQLRLIRIRNLAPQALSASADSRTATFYKHGLEIEFEGSYFGCFEYLQEIEALPWRFYWQLLDLEVLDYPTNRVRLEVSTLSLDEEWIGA